jgi:hypothetical protein
MSGPSALIAVAVSALALSTALPAGAAATDPGGSGARSCFRATAWENWRAAGPDVLYLRVRHKEVYRVDLAAGSQLLKSVGAILVSNVHGTDLVCSPLDLDLSVADPSGFSIRLIPKAITKLTPEEVTAIPAKYRP